MKIPQFELKAQYKSIEREILAALERVCASGRYILGPEGEALERELAEYCGARHAVGCASGSEALLLSLTALGVGAGDEVVTVPLTFFGTAGAVARLGGRAVFVDIEPRSYLMDPNRLEDYLKGLDGERRKRTRAVIAVHFYGQPAEMDAILELARRYDLAVVEDAAQAVGAEIQGRRVGSLGRAGCLSFYPSKNLGAYGDAGMVTTNDEALAGQVRALRHHGSRSVPYKHELVGWNSRLDEMQAAILRVKLKHLEEWTQARQERARRYDQLFFDARMVDMEKTYPDRDSPLVLPRQTEGRRHVFHQYVIRAKQRDELMQFLAQAGVETRVYYPLPVHLQPCFADWGGRAGDFPEAERAVGEILALPLYPELAGEQQDYVVSKVREFYGIRPGSGSD